MIAIRFYAARITVIFINRKKPGAWHSPNSFFEDADLNLFYYERNQNGRLVSTDKLDIDRF